MVNWSLHGSMQWVCCAVFSKGCSIRVITSSLPRGCSAHLSSYVMIRKRTKEAVRVPISLSDLGDPVLVRGVSDKPQSENWCEHVTNVLLGCWPARANREAVECAELSLGISDSPYYFYVLRTDAYFGNAIFLFRDHKNWHDHVYGATPFDSGLFAEGSINTHPPIHEPHSRRDFFQEKQDPLIRWKEKFRSYIERNYKNLESYIKGYYPKHGSPIVSSGHSDPRAWTWEVRIPIQFVSNNVTLLHVFLNEEDLPEYRLWVRRHRPRDHAVIASFLRSHLWDRLRRCPRLMAHRLARNILRYVRKTPAEHQLVHPVPTGKAIFRYVRDLLMCEGCTR